MTTTISEDGSAGTGPTADQGQITLNDLAVLLQVVNLATERGAFRANELTQVGSVYDKVQTFLAKVEAEQNNKAEQEAAAQEAVAE